MNENDDFWENYLRDCEIYWDGLNAKKKKREKKAFFNFLRTYELGTTKEDYMNSAKRYVEDMKKLTKEGLL